MGPPQAFPSSPFLTIPVSHGLLNTSSSPRLGVQFRNKQKPTLWHSRFWTLQNTIGQHKTEANFYHHLSPSVIPMALSLQSHLHPNLSHPFSCCSNLKTNWDLTSHQPWLARHTTPRRRLLVRASVLHEYPLVVQHLHLHAPNSLLFLLTETVGYSLASYYTSLGLFVISVPGLWSLIKRSVKSKIVQKTYISDGEVKKEPKQVAGEILSFFSRNNFVVTDRGETITFEGMMVPSRGQAALLTFCTCISMASVALVLTITFPDFGNNWFWLTILSPLAGAYYWRRALRKEQIKVKVVVADDGMLSEIIAQGDDQQVEQMRKELQLNEKGMVYVKGLFER